MCTSAWATMVPSSAACHPHCSCATCTRAVAHALVCGARTLACRVHTRVNAYLKLFAAISSSRQSEHPGQFVFARQRGAEKCRIVGIDRNGDASVIELPHRMLFSSATAPVHTLLEMQISSGRLSLRSWAINAGALAAAIP